MGRIQDLAAQGSQNHADMLAREGLASDTENREGAGGAMPDTEEKNQNQSAHNEQDIDQQNHADVENGDYSQNAVNEETDSGDFSAEEGSGFSQEDAVSPDGEEMPANSSIDSLEQGIAADLNGIDPATGQGGNGNTTEQMERDINMSNSGSGADKSGLGSEPIEFGGTMFRAEWKDTLSHGTENSLSNMPNMPSGDKSKVNKKRDLSDLENK